MQKQTRKIGLNRGKRRIWLEGAILTDNGINHGQRFNVINSPNSLVIVIDPAGKRKIAGKANRPIIDMSGATITDSFSDVTQVVTVEKGRIGISLVLTGVPVLLP